MATDLFKLHFLLHSATLVEEELRKRLARIDMRPRQARMIDALARMEPASQVTLARAFGITPSSMSTMTARLIDGGYITRVIDPNETRSNILRLTDRGRDLLADIHEAWRDIDAMIAARLGETDAQTLSTLTRALRDSLGGHAPGRAVHAEQTEPLETNR
ncbi:Transcriptional regulator SlyA [Sulfitobacter sp. DSM 110093]|uniref:MarR family winged helix-turn-helix transcriptional regulator n=1 Tax=Sulfitobacter sp. DSM 110093 TaxID=2883127 RepID=UPI001FACFC75|nr:MarR family winged helix-turn-helix transcriptional regulator [Sulfitobacter sp. DSM 110093]UOA32794.1 Transcriptional regulator SlyA [Sulfitobacter sp. DSM 110093]